jgi:Fe-S cluster assembly ATP-binding protein
MRSSERAMILVTHYQRLLNYVTPDVVHVMVGGTIVKSGGKDLALKLEEKGYADFAPAELASQGANR